MVEIEQTDSCGVEVLGRDSLGTVSARKVPIMNSESSKALRSNVLIYVDGLNALLVS